MPAATLTLNFQKPIFHKFINDPVTFTPWFATFIILKSQNDVNIRKDVKSSFDITVFNPSNYQNFLDTSVTCT